MQVEIELRRGWWWGALPIAALMLIGLALLGRSVTPQAGGLLTPAEWQMLRDGRAYAQELTHLRGEAEVLTELLNRTPDAVRAGAASERIAQDALEGQPSLELQRAALMQAAEAVRQWAMGGSEREAAQSALEDAVRLLEGRP